MNKEINVRSTMDNLDTVLGFIEGNLEMAECPMKIAMKIAVCVEELYVNVVNYAYDGQEGACRIEFRFEENTPNKAVITIVDQGKPFNPLEKEDPNTTLDAEERDIGGLGIFMVKNIMDTIIYERKEEKNIIIMEKSW
ncbi:MAG: ATP-binding protein [Lachnospiraceae bacterium]|nr:ATP-binding protein [Lachnospiraceae bacterium]